MARVVIVGGSFGGLTAAFELQKRVGSAHTITLLSNSSQFVFIPSLPWVAMGWQDAARITFGIERPLAKRGINFVPGTATAIDTAVQKVISTAGGIPYDYLVIATGSGLDYSTVPGLEPALGVRNHLHAGRRAGSPFPIERAIGGGQRQYGHRLSARCQLPRTRL